MSCNIEKNKFGKITKVLNNQGKPSKLFQQLFNVPVFSLMESINTYKNVYAKKVQDRVYYQIIGEQGASKVAEYKQSLDKAKELDKQGVSVSEVEKQTGWYKNSQKQWKKFADDYVEQLSFKANYLKNLNSEISVGELLNENIILQLYPEIKNLKVVFYDKTNKNIPQEAEGANGYLQTDEGTGISTIFIQTREGQGEMDKIIFSHELNHYLQRVEGFAKGGNEQTTVLLAMAVAKVRRGSGGIREQFTTFLNNQTQITKEDRKVVEEGIKFLDSENKDEFSFAQYLRLRGEIDSRAVEEAVRLNKIGKTYSEIVNDILKKDNISDNDIIDIFGIEQLLNSKQETDEINRLSPTEEQGTKRAGSIAEGAYNTLRRSEATVSKNQRGEKQEDELRVWSYDNGYYIEDYRELGEFQDKGMESEVFYNKDSNSVIKVNDLEFYETPIEFLQSVALHNEIFPDTLMTIKGFTTRQDTFKFAFIIEQPFILAERGATQEEVKEEMKKLGFEYIGENSYKNDRYTIEDLHEANVLVDSNDKLRFIDTVIRLNNTEIQEPSATFNGYSTYKQAVKNTQIGEKIDIKIGDVSVASVTNNGAINDLIRQNIIEDVRELQPDGKIVYKTQGEDLDIKLINAHIAKQVLGGVINKSGDIRVEQKQDIEIKQDFSENEKELGEITALSILATDALVNNTPAFGDGRIISEEIEVPSDTVLMSKLKGLLNQLGIKTMSLEAWQKRVGSNATPNALADITNKIVAFANGEITEDQLTEETAHFIIEGLDQEKVKPLLDLVHKTDEWREYSQTYMEIYKNEEQVRREILGKVLKNTLQNRAKQQETLQGQSILDRIVNLFNDFIIRFKNLLTDTHINQLETFTNEVYDKLMTEELFNELSPEQFDGNKLIMYQAQVSDTTYQSIAKLLDKVSMIDKRTGSTHQVDLSKINQEELDLVSQLEAVAGIASVIKKQVNYLNQRGKKKSFLSTEESFVYNTTSELGVMLKNISAKLEDVNFNKFGNHKKKALESAKEAQEVLTELEANLNKEKEERFDSLVNELVEQNGLTEHQRDILLKELRSTERDTRLFYSMFGGIIHAQNPVLNMLAKRISRMNKETEVEFSQNLNELFSKLNDLEYKDEQVSKLFKKWAKGYNLMSAFDFDAYEEAVAKEKLKAYKEVDPTSSITLQDIIEKEEEWKQKLSQEKVADYRFLSNKYINDAGVKVDSLSKENRKEFKDKIDSLNLSLKTEKLITEFKNKRSAVYRKGSMNNGYSEEDLQQLKEINADYQRESDVYDRDGNLKKGLVIDENGKVSSSIPKEQLEDDVRTTLELNEYREALKELYAGNEKNVFASFFKQIEEIRSKGGGQKEVEDFIFLNSRIFFTDSFWNSFDKNDSLADRLKATDNTSAVILAEKIEKTNRKLKNILKRNREYNQPSQMNYSEMSGSEEREIKELSSSLEQYFREAKQYLPKAEFNRIDSIAETTTNKAYAKEVQKRGLVEFRERLEFIRRHITENSNRAVSRMMDRVEMFEQGDEIPLGLAGIATEEEILNDKNDVLIRYAESKLLPYFKETRPKDVSVEGIIADMSDAKTAKEFEDAAKISEYISVNPSFIFEDADVSDRLNKEFKNRIDNNEPLINLEKFANKEFFSYFGISNTGSFSVNSAVATKNKEEFEAWKALVEFQENALEYTNMTGKHNKYQLPQYRRGSYARVQQIVENTSLEKIKEGFKDVFTYREDDPELGQGVEGEINQLYEKGNLTIPKTGFIKLEKADEVTDELLYSYMLMMREAVKYKKRTEAWSDVEAMEHYVKGKAYGDKDKEKTQTYKMFDDFKRYAIFGQKETFKLETDLFGLLSKKRNLTPAINFFQSYVRNNNLAYAILTPMTSFLQGSTNFIVENVLGDRINKDAARLASAEMPKLMTQAVGEHFNVRAKSKMNKLYQFVGIDNPSERFENSNYGKVARNLAIGKSGYVTHFLADAPLQAQTVLTILHDYRIVEGDIIDYNSWRRKNRALTEKEAHTKWKEYQDDVLYKHLEEAKNEKGEDLGYLKPDTSIEAIEGWQNKMQQVRDRITLAKQEIDNQISEGDKGMVQRNALFSWTTLHKGWLVTSMTKRFKGRHMNMFNNMMEEGTYLGTANFLTGMMKEVRKEGFKNAWKKQFNNYDGGYKLENNIIYDEMGQVLKTFATSKEAEEYFEELKFDFTKMRQISVKRTFADFMVSNLIAMMGIALSQMADDEDDDYVKEFMAYTAFRLATEVTSQSTGFPAQAFSFLESPTVGMSQLQNTLDVFDIFDGEEINRGTYRGYTKSQAWFLKALPGVKEANKLYHIDRTRNSFEFFNRKNLKFTLAGQMMIE